jgi:hypothetical protein
VRIPPIISILLLFPKLAHADFDPATGMVGLDDAAFGIAFDGPSSFPDGLTVQIYDQSFTPITDLESVFVQGELTGIEGAGSLELGGEHPYMLLDLRSIAEPLRGRRVEIKLWQRLKTTVAGIELSWYTGDVEAALRGERDGSYQRVGVIPFQPSGRATDDGWVEWTSGPIDFSLAGIVDPTFLTFFDEHVAYAYQQVASFDPTVRVGIDALGIYDLGPATVPAISCNLIDEATACGPMGACQFGQCADAAAVIGPKLENLALREEYLFRRMFLIENLEGGRGPLASLANFRSKLDPLHGETSNKSYWTAIAEAFDGLADGHASEPLPTYPSQLATGICLYLGEADLLPGTPIAPLVLEANANAIGSSLQIGDALVAIDGIPVSDWRAAATRLLRYGGDPRGREYITTPQLMNAALMTGAVLTFQRPNQAQPIEIDLGELASGFYTGELPDWRFDFIGCDYRFQRPVQDPAVREYAFAGFADDGGVRSVLINGVPAYYGRGGEEWFATIESALNGSGPALLALDERQGAGGSIEAVDLIASHYLAPDDFFGMDLLPQVSQTLDRTLVDALRECSATNQTFYGGCGNAFQWILGQQNQFGGEGLASTQKLAVMTGLDVSGNDYLTKLLTYRSAETRIFGAVPTYGAFGVVWSLPALAGELTGGSVQVQDTIFVAQPSDTNLDFNTGTGISPDEVVLQKQSDAIAGVDTLVARARAWLAE